MTSRRNTLYTKTIDYTAVEEYLDSLFVDDPMPMSVTAAIKQCSRKFQTNREYSGKSIHDAVHEYYDGHFGGASKVRNTLIAMSNNTRTITKETKKKMSESHTIDRLKFYERKYLAARTEKEKDVIHRLFVAEVIRQCREKHRFDELKKTVKVTNGFGL